MTIATEPAAIPESWFGHSREVQLSGALMRSIRDSGLLDSSIYIALHDFDGKADERWNNFVAANDIKQDDLAFRKDKTVRTLGPLTELKAFTAAEWYLVDGSHRLFNFKHLVEHGQAEPSSIKLKIMKPLDQGEQDQLATLLNAVASSTCTESIVDFIGRCARFRQQGFKIWQISAKDPMGTLVPSVWPLSFPIRHNPDLWKFLTDMGKIAKGSQKRIQR